MKITFADLSATASNKEAKLLDDRGAEKGYSGFFMQTNILFPLPEQESIYLGSIRFYLALRWCRRVLSNGGLSQKRLLLYKIPT